MSRKETPSPEPGGMIWLGWLVGASYSLLVALLILALPERHEYWAWAASVPVVVFLGYQLYGWCLLLIALLVWRPQDIHGVLVYSESPNWKSYIEERWLPRAGGRLRILNWSDRRTWRNSLAVRIFDRYVGRWHNFNPSVVLLRGLRYPLVFRCFYAFRDAKHGNQQALRDLEEKLFRELSIPVA